MLLRMLNPLQRMQIKCDLTDALLPQGMQVISSPGLEAYGMRSSQKGGTPVILRSAEHI